MSKLVEVQTIGANRGGREFRNQMMAKNRDLPDLIGHMSIGDLDYPKAERLAYDWQRDGINATPEEIDARCAKLIGTDMRTLLLDDPEALHRVINEPWHEDVLQFGVLAGSDDPNNGIVLGIGGTLSKDDPETREKTCELINQLYKLTGGSRVTSQAISTRAIESIQMNPARAITHDELAKDAVKYLEGEKPRSNLYLAESFTQSPNSIYPIELMKLDRPLSKRELDGMAEDIAKNSGHDEAAVVFYDPNRPWIYTTLISKPSSVLRPKWNRRASIEMPVSSDALEVYRIARAPEPSRITLTD